MGNIIKKELGKVSAFIIVFIAFAIIMNSNNHMNNDMKSIVLTKDAQLFYNGTIVCMGDVSKYDVTEVDFDDEVTIKKEINMDIENAVISFNNMLNVAYEVRIDGKKIHSYGMKSPENSVVCNNWVCIPIGSNVKGKTIELTLRCINGKVFAKIPEVLCMNCKDELVSFTNINLEYLIIGFVMIVIGIMLLLIMRINVVFNIFNKKVVFLALSCITAGSWIFACFQIYRILFSSYIIDFYLEYLSLGFTIFFMNLYVSELYKEGLEKKILFYVNIALCTVTSLMVILQITNIVYMNDSVISMQLCAVATIILLLRYYYKEVKKNLMASLLLLIETISFGMIIVYYILSHIASKGIDFLNLLILVFFLYILQAVTRIIQEIKADYVMSAEEKSIARLAYMDTLTGLSNRRGLYKFVNNLDKNVDNAEYGICSFDLNRLKLTNDTFGHSAGDTLIKSFANELKAITKENIDFCGRMGGDEFIVIIAKDRINKALESLKNNIKEKNESGIFEYEVSYSVGTADYVNNGKDDFESCIKLADSAMYEMKNVNHKQLAVE